VEPDITVRTSHFHFLFVVVGASAITNPANDEDSSTNGGSWNQGDSPAAAFAARRQSHRKVHGVKIRLSSQCGGLASHFLVQNNISISFSL
jgi:hypothetical protein